MVGIIRIATLEAGRTFPSFGYRRGASTHGARFQVGEAVTIAMIDQVQTASIPVSDQERARDFYVDTLGFELRTESEWGKGTCWIEVAPKGPATSLTLVTWFESMPLGSLQGLVVATEDIQTTHEELAAKGVYFDFPPTEMSGGCRWCSATPTATGWCSGSVGSVI